MIVGIFILVWAFLSAGMMFFQNKEQKKREYKLLCRIEMLETKIEKMENNDPYAEKIRKIGKMATELLTVLQEKEDDIKALFEKLEEKASLQIEKTVSAPVIKNESNIKQFQREKEPDKGTYSASELHTIEMLKKRRQA